MFLVVLGAVQKMQKGDGMGSIWQMQGEICLGWCSQESLEGSIHYRVWVTEGA